MSVTLILGTDAAHIADEVDDQDQQDDREGDGRDQLRVVGGGDAEVAFDRGPTT